MTVIVSFTVEAADIVFGQVLAETETRIDLTQFIPIEDDFIPYFWKERDGDSQVFEQRVREHPAVRTLENLDGRVEAALYRINWTDEVDGFLDALREHDVLVERATTNHGERWLFRLRAFDQTELSSFQSACYQEDIDIDIQRMVPNPDSDGMTSQALVGVTGRQREALDLALEHGYFEIPRENNATELAEMLGISRPAFARRLRRAEQSIFSNLLLNLDT